MRIENKQCEIFMIHDAPALDPITVILQDFGPNRGRLIIECYGRIWTAFWGSMGGNIRHFLSTVNSGYVLNKVSLPSHLIKKSEVKNEEKYLLRIIEAVLSVIKQQEAEKRARLIDRLVRSFENMPARVQTACKHSMGAPTHHPETGEEFTSFRQVLEVAADSTLDILRADFECNGDLLPEVPA